jgi:LPXTG-site transpeptidase (sortase) family protein
VNQFVAQAKANKKILLIRTIGNFLFLTALIGLIFTFWPIISVTTKHFSDKLIGKEFQAAQEAFQRKESFGSLLGKEEENVDILIPKDPNFSIIVEKIGADAPVIQNVNAAKKSEYEPALRKGVAHALGTAFPGQPGVTYLFAHSTDTIFNVPRYNAIFYLLWDIKPKDNIVIFFQGKRHNYVVTETKITEPEDVSYFTLETSSQLLVLQTCYPPGTTWKRFLVIAKPVSEIAQLINLK